jgi:hypothetical protein
MTNRLTLGPGNRCSRSGPFFRTLNFRQQNPVDPDKLLFYKIKYMFSEILLKSVQVLSYVTFCVDARGYFLGIQNVRGVTYKLAAVL